ncbi:DUF547 domain-containing protein [Natronomonas sp. CBA1123]|uniref:DUF547 domain-containing protein n=1 Tax=Natronomonas sp. CBA1123 TaxID=2668070 RepID=UPI0012E9A694|nr:DUF547 domain-containing protein [Natronomonas sp. CBA1123]
MDDPLALAEAYLRSVRRSESAHEIAASLRDLPRERLHAALDGDAERLAFWLNVYNATAQSVLSADPAAFEARSSFFRAPLVAVSGRDLSLDDVEHGMLRRSHPKWGFGYVPNPFSDAFERAFRVEERDPRIHFALNCGAASCPPIAAYEADRIDAQLDLASGGYLDSEAVYDAEAGVVTIPRLMLWFRGDFGGRRGILQFLRKYDAIPADVTPDIDYADYDWSLDAGRFAPVSEW